MNKMAMVLAGAAGCALLLASAEGGILQRLFGRDRGEEKPRAQTPPRNQTPTRGQGTQASGGKSVTPAGLKAALEYTKARGGHALVVMENGKVLLEDYHNGFSKGEEHRLASGTKSFCGMICAALIEDGKISSFDEKVSLTITEWKNDPLKSSMTLRQLLSLVGGLDPGENGKPPTYAQAIRVRSIHRPGESFDYGPTALQVFGEVVTRKLKGVYPNAYAKQRIFDPIGMRMGKWLPVGGEPNMGGGGYIEAMEWAKYGEFMRQYGAWNGKQIVRRDLVEELTKPPEHGTHYGLNWWLAADTSEEGAVSEDPRRQRKMTTITDPRISGFFFAAGLGKQRLYVNRELGLTIVRFGESKTWNNEEFLRVLLQ